MRDAVGDDIDIMVDCHARPSPAMGMKFAQALDPYGLYFLEEPCWPESIEGLAAINAAVTTPIATASGVTHLAAFRDLFAARAARSARWTSRIAAALPKPVEWLRWPMPIVLLWLRTIRKGPSAPLRRLSSASRSPVT